MVVSAARKNTAMLGLHATGRNPRITATAAPRSCQREADSLGWCAEELSCLGPSGWREAGLDSTPFDGYRLVECSVAARHEVEIFSDGHGARSGSRAAAATVGGRCSVSKNVARSLVECVVGVIATIGGWPMAWEVCDDGTAH